MKKIMAKDISFDETVKAGLAYEQGAKKVEEMRRKDDRKEMEKVARLNITAGRKVEFDTL